jgi:2,4-dichlorophenol 6-monooxygenase
MELKNYEFNAHGVELGQFYASSAVLSDGSRLPAPTRDPELYYEMSTVPGSHLPHAWVGDSSRRLALMDLAPYTRFTLLTGIAGEAWAQAAEKVATELGVPLEAVVIGPGREVTDLYYDWAKLREVEESGVLLVRPDKHIGGVR